MMSRRRLAAASAVRPVGSSVVNLSDAGLDTARKHIEPAVSGGAHASPPPSAPAQLRRREPVPPRLTAAATLPAVAPNR